MNNSELKRSDFFFDLPEELIAKYPPEKRGESRLLILDRMTGRRQHRMAFDLPEILAGKEYRSYQGEAPLLVFNNSRVRKARLKAHYISGHETASKETEFLLLNRVDSHIWRCMVNHTKRRRPKQRYCFAGGLEGEIIEAPAAEKDNESMDKISMNEFRYLRFDSPIDDEWLDIHGHIPLPPYIKRDDEKADAERYQTIYASRTAASTLGSGASSAAPTAGLHFTEEMFNSLKAAGIGTAFITLHVGLGTFLPVRSEHIKDHIMHEESYMISEETARQINTAKAAGRKIIAVGTTSLRSLESASADTEKELRSSELRSIEGSTSLFIYPGYRFKISDALFTNFHTPGSTLLMLAAAFAGRELILKTYTEAIQEHYRFFSYGDAMLIN
jgi:S-adenosylmethionine:tRNA ribosyltransferase-isomerase